MRFAVILMFFFWLTACQQEQSIEQANQVEVANESLSSQASESDYAANQSANSLYQKSVQTLLTARPSYATVLGVDDSLAGENYAAKIGDFSPEAEKNLRHRLSELNKEITTLESEAGQAQENQQVMQRLTRYFSGHPDFEIGFIDTWMGLSPFIINQINGPLIDVPNRIVTNHRIESLSDAEDYLARLNAFNGFVQSVVAKLAADTDNGWIPPKVIIEKSIQTLNNFIAPEVTDHPLYTVYAEKLNQLATISNEQRQNLLSTAKDLIERNVYAAYGLVIELQQQLLSKAPIEAGIWAQPKGAEFYQDAIAMLADTDFDAEGIHQLGLDEVTRINVELDKLLTAQGYASGSVTERIKNVNNEARYLYPDDAEGRMLVIADLNRYIDEITPKLDDLFKQTPPYGIEVRAFAKSREASAPGGMYTAPSIDGSQPGIYWINLRDMKAVPTFEMKTLTYHEANPGHHWQVASNLAQADLPMLRRIASFNAYSEGWALYSELLAKEMGQYDDDPMSDIGRLKAELFRAVRLVVDTGLHHKKWSREQAIDYMMDVGAVVESDAIVEVERYMVWPAQALGYKLGMIEILKLREQAQQQLGNQFNLKEFHNWILEGGAVPMPLLQQRVKQAIAAVLEKNKTPG